jgi:hypothetical protein
VELIGAGFPGIGAAITVFGSMDTTGLADEVI